VFKNYAYIALGSNIGDKLGYFKMAVDEIRNSSKCCIEKVSSVYETLPYGNKDQENFFNAAIGITTDLEMLELLALLKSIERKLGRVNGPRWGPREIDLDLLFYNNLVYSDEKITVPHKEVTKRDFVLVPLCEIAPKLIHPELNQKICDICIDDPEKNVISRIPDKII
jgi:2-amino-4-hydroxy-6-hydroxymethyldihydropteridine diphosphokinase